jgi:hypothetical protein
MVDMNKRMHHNTHKKSSQSWSLGTMWRGLKGQAGATEEPEAGKAVTAQDVHKVRLEDMLLLLHRTSSTVSDSAIFSERGVSLEGWAVLCKIGPGGSTVPQIAKNLRISRRRVMGVVVDLADRRLIAISQSGEGRRPGRSVAILPKGGEILSHISSQLKSLDRMGNERPFNHGQRALRGVLRAFPHRKKPVALDVNR